MNILLDNNLEYIPFGDFSSAELEESIDIQLKIAKDVIEKQLKSQQYSWDETIVSIDNVLYKLNSLWSLLHHLLSVLDNQDLRNIQDKYQEEITNFYLSLAQNEQLFNVFNILKTKNLSEEQIKVIDNSLFEFKQNGFYLNPEDRSLFNQIASKLDNLMTKFSQNVLDSTEKSAIYVEISELNGIPLDIIQLYKEQAIRDNKDGLYKISFHMSSYLPLMQYADNRQLRQMAYKIYVTRASELSQPEFDNKKIINEIVYLRYKKAKLLGYDNYTELSLVKKMANNAQQILDFLDSLITKSLPYAEDELKMLQDYAKNNYNIDKIEPWDISYLSEKLKNEQYKYSEQELKQYFEIDNVLKGLFELINNLYKVTFIFNPNIKSWHSDVIYFDLYQDNKQIGGIYFDLFSRDKKHSGAWMNSMQDRYVTKDFEKKPIAYIICNFTPKNEQGKSYLTIEEVQTIFHEMGHALHHLLTKVEHYSISGINNVEWDAVELPSQFMELFTWNYEILSKLSAHAISNEVLPMTLFQKVLQSRYYQAGLQMLRQIEFAKFDLLLHNYQEPNILDYENLLNEIRQTTSLIPATSYNKFANSFSHIFSGGYAAGYYSYKWAEVLASDVFSQFEQIKHVEDLFPIGKKFLNDVLSKGSINSMADNFLSFMGRNPEIDALLKYSFGK